MSLWLGRTVVLSRGRAGGRIPAILMAIQGQSAVRRPECGPRPGSVMLTGKECVVR